MLCMMSIKTNLGSRAGSSPGRPRSFAPDQALAGALDVFWHKGYEATSLDDLTGAMGLSRSSFYACFGSKREALMAAIRRYTDDFHREITVLAASEPDPIRAATQVLTRIADVQGGARGCFFVNAVVELAPHDPALATFSRKHLARIETLVANLAIKGGMAEPLAADRASAALSMVMGAVMLRKAGVPQERLQAVLDQAKLLVSA